MVTCARARLRALPPRAEFLYDADHPATSWLLWGRPPSGPTACTSGANDATTVTAAGYEGQASSSDPSTTSGPSPVEHAAAVGSSNAIRGMLHHAVSFDPPQSDGALSTQEPSLNGDTLFVCHYEMPLSEGSTERLSLGYAFGGVTNINGVVAECEAPQLDTELARVLEVDPALPSARPGQSESSPYDGFWLEETEEDIYPGDFGNGSDCFPLLDDTLSSAPAVAEDTVSIRDMSTAIVLPREQAVPPGRRFAAMLLHNLVYLISVVRIGRHIVMIDIYHVNYDPLAVDIEGRHCNNSIHIMYDPTGMMFGCLADSTQCISETLTFLEEICTVCNVPKAQCPCLSEQIVCANCTSFADLSSRLRSGSTWRYSRMNCERVSLRRSADEPQQLRRMRSSIWLESVDGLSSLPRTAEMRRRFFNFTGMLVSSPLLLQPSEKQNDDVKSITLPDIHETSSTQTNDVHDASPSQYACPSCPKVFHRKAGLQRHKRTVHGPRRHECDQCGAKFQQGAHLKTHKVLVHAKSLNFICDHCNMRFPLRSRLTTHLKSKHGIQTVSK